jgi:hypothetical protein
MTSQTINTASGIHTITAVMLGGTISAVFILLYYNTSIVPSSLVYVLRLCLQCKLQHTATPCNLLALQARRITACPPHQMARIWRSSWLEGLQVGMNGSSCMLL